MIFAFQDITTVQPSVEKRPWGQRSFHDIYKEQFEMFELLHSLVHPPLYYMSFLPHIC